MPVWGQALVRRFAFDNLIQSLHSLLRKVPQPVGWVCRGFRPRLQVRTDEL